MEGNVKEQETAKDKLSDALICIMKEKPFEEISVTDISERAKVSRMAFYRNAQSKEDLLRYRIEKLSQRFIMQNGSLIFCSLPQYYENLFSFFLEKKEFFALLERAGFLYMVKDIIDRYYFEQARSVEEKKDIREYESYYFSGALYNVFLLWERKGMQESPKEMAHLYCRISQSGWDKKQ